eukprot:1735766-Amphidinium_carterae.1
MRRVAKRNEDGSAGQYIRLCCARVHDSTGYYCLNQPSMTRRFAPQHVPRCMTNVACMTNHCKPVVSLSHRSRSSPW